MADKREVLGSLDLGGQSPESLTIAEYLKALGNGSSRPASPFGEVLKADGSVVQPAPEGKSDPATPESILDAQTSLWSRITDGTATLDEFKAGFENWVSRKADVIEALSKNKKDDLLKMGSSMFVYRNKSENKPEIVEARKGLFHRSKWWSAMRTAFNWSLKPTKQPFGLSGMERPNIGC